MDSGNDDDNFVGDAEVNPSVNTDGNIVANAGANLTTNVNSNPIANADANTVSVNTNHTENADDDSTSDSGTSDADPDWDISSDGDWDDPLNSFIKRVCVECSRNADPPHPTSINWAENTSAKPYCKSCYEEKEREMDLMANTDKAVKKKNKQNKNNMKK